MRCPQCGSEQADGTAICDACDAILDPSFLGEDAALIADDEGTDPGIAAPAEGGTQIVDTGALQPRDRDESTFVGAAPDRAGAEEDAWEDEEEEYEYEDEEEYEEEADDGYETFDYRRYVEADAGTSRPEPDEVISARPGATAAHTSQGAARAQAAARGRGRLKDALEFDTSSQLMDDYDQLFQNLWASFLAMPAADKVYVLGAAMAALTALLPWRIEVSPAGVADEIYGLFDMGWLGLLLAGGAIALAWIRRSPSTPPERSRLLALGAVALCAGGLVWSIVSLSVAASSGEVLIGNPYGVTPGAAYGIYMHLASWTVAGIGAFVSLKDLPAGRGPRRR